MRAFLFAFLAFFFFFSHLFAESRTQRPLLEKPDPYSSEMLERKIKAFQAHHLSFYKAKDWYRMSLIYIRGGKFDLASQALHQALTLDPRYKKAQLQLGYIYLWQKNFATSQKLLMDLSCDEMAVDGLMQIAHFWEKEKKRAEASQIYRHILRCFPDNPDALYFLGRILSETNQTDDAEDLLLKCLRILPHNEDAALLLGSLYSRQKRWDLAENIYASYLNNADARKNYARIPYLKGDLSASDERVKTLLEEYPEDLILRKTLAKDYFTDLKFKKAKMVYEEYLQYSGADGEIWRDLFEIRSHTAPSIVLDSSYLASKENDPTLKVPVVRDYYFNNFATLLFPVFDALRFEARGDWGYQKELNIYSDPHHLNYYVDYLAASISSKWFFQRDWRWDLSCKVVRGWNVKNNLPFPFLNTTRINPATSLNYHHEEHAFFFEAHFEDLVIKNFITLQSKFFTQRYVDAFYRYRSQIHLHPELEGFMGIVFYEDHIHNIETFEHLSIRSFSPIVNKFFILSYDFEHDKYNHLTPNYTSFKDRYRHVIGVKLHKEWKTHFYAEILYNHRWQFTYKLIQPIGTFLYVASKQKLVANMISGLLGYRFKDRVRLEMNAHYFKDTLPYRDWYVHGNLIWEF